MVVGRSQDTISLLMLYPVIPHVKNGSSSCLYDIHDKIGTTKHIIPIIFYYIKIYKTRPLAWFTNRTIYDSRVKSYIGFSESLLCMTGVRGAVKPNTYDLKHGDSTFEMLIACQ